MTDVDICNGLPWNGPSFKNVQSVVLKPPLEGSEARFY